MKYGSVGPISLLFTSGSTLWEAQRSACEIVMSRKSSQASDSIWRIFSGVWPWYIFCIASSVRM